MPARQNLYFIAIIPPQAICDDITAFKTDIANRFHSSHALKTVPHITLKAPFKLLSTYHASLLSWLHQPFLSQPPFEQAIDGFGAFHNARNPVLFVKPVSSPPLLALQAEVLRSFQNEFSFLPVSDTERDYHPHITIGFRDLSSPHFRAAWAEYGRKVYKATFTVHGFYLLQHDGSAWQPVAAASLP